MNNEFFASIIKRNRIIVIIGAILTFLIGLVCVLAPLVAGSILVWVMVGLVGVFAIFAIVKFIYPGQGKRRSGWALAVAIVLLLSVITIILCGIFAKDVHFQGETYRGIEVMTARMLAFASICFGVVSVFNNVFILASVSQTPSGRKGWVIAKSILGIIIGILLTLLPFLVYYIAVIFGGIYLIVMSIVAIVIVIRLSKATKNIGA